MRRTARVLSAAALAGAVLAGAVPAAFAEPTAEVSPAAVAPGGSVTVSVSCDPLGGPAPKTLNATSQAFADGTVQLSLVPGNDELSGPGYRGTARIAPAADLDAPAEAVGTDSAWTVDTTCPAPPGGQGSLSRGTFDVSRNEAPRDDSSGGEAFRGDSSGDEVSGDDFFSGDEVSGDDDASRDDASRDEASWDDAPTCTPSRDASCDGGKTCAEGAEGAAGPEGHENSCASEKQPCTEGHEDASCAPEKKPCTEGHGDPSCAADKPCPHGHGDPSCTTAPLQHGVRAGAGGAFSDSVPALVAGGLLIAGAFGAAVHRLRRRGSAGDV